MFASGLCQLVRQAGESLAAVPGVILKGDNAVSAKWYLFY